MAKTARSSISKHGSAILLAVALLTIAGAMAGWRLPVSLFPFIDYPRVVVSVDAGERDAATMAASITRPVEIALRAVPGAKSVRSTTSRGSAEVAVDFAWGQDMVAATLETEAALASILPDLPQGARFNVRRSDPTIFPVYGIALTSDSLSPADLRQLAELKLLPSLISVDGVAGVDILGSSPREFAVNLDPARLGALGLTLDDVSKSLAAQNAVNGVGRLTDQHQLFLVLVDDRLTSIADLEDTPVTVGGQSGPGVVRLGDIADISSALEPSYTLVNSGGQSAVLLNVRQALQGDTVKIVKDVQQRLDQSGLPPSVKVTPFYDQSELVSGAANAVRDAILIGALLAGLVLFVFLRSWRLMVLTGLLLPAVLAAACVALELLGLGFNMMTLGGMAAAVGLVIDDAVVVLEHMMRRMQEKNSTAEQHLLGAAAEMGRPLLGSTFATIVVFIPLAFVSGVTGGFFKSLAITMVACLVVSLLYARFAIPLLAARWLTEKDAEQVEKGEKVMNPLIRAYDRSGGTALARPGLFVLLVGGVLGVLGYLSWSHVPSGFMPAMDEGGFILDYRAPPGTALDDTDQMLRQVETIISSTPEVASYSRRTGIQLGGGLTEASEGDYFVRLNGGSRRNIEAVMSEIRDKVAQQVPALEVETAQLMEDLIGDLTAVPQPIEVKLFSNDEAELEAAAKQVGSTLSGIQGVVEVVDGLRVAGSDITVRVDRGAAVQAGLDPQAISDQLSALIDGTVATQIRDGEQLVGVRVRGPEDLRQHIAQVQDMVLRAPDGHSVRLAQVATVEVVGGAKQLTREQLAPFIGVTARLEGRSLGAAMSEVQGKVQALNLPAGIRVEYGGLYSQQQQSFSDLAMVFSAAILLTLLLVTILYGRFYWGLAAVTTILLVASSSLLGLWITGIELNISALMGLTMVVGMVSELIIFYLAELPENQKIGLADLREAGVKRLRPILMSALIAILTLLPLAIGFSRGAGLQQPLATSIIFGLLAAVPLVLLFLPAMLAMRSEKIEQEGQAGIR
ncbi:MAG: efflux RND transporter permease subunit [Tsuneonella suprasediminis]